MINHSATVKHEPTRESSTNKALPCRGCTLACKNYHHCGGLLWRMDGRSASVIRPEHRDTQTSRLLKNVFEASQCKAKIGEKAEFMYDK